VNLCQIMMNIPDPVQLTCKLFHAVNKMYIHDGFIFCFHPSCSQQAREVVTGLLVFLTGLWEGTINMMKFHKFFTDGAIERARKAWWDTDTLCVVTKADQEMANILTYDTDLIFPETQLDLEMVGANTPAETIVKIQDDLLSTGLILTFQSTATATTKQTQVTRKSSSRTKTPKSNATATTDTDLVTSSVTLSEGDIQTLLFWLMQAMNMQQNNPKQKEQTGGDKFWQPQMNHQTTGDHSSSVTRSDIQKIARKGRKQQCIINYIKTASQATITKQQTTEKTQNNEINNKNRNGN